MTCLLLTSFEIASARGDRSLLESNQTAAADKITFAVIGDTGTGEKNQFAVAQRIRKGDIRRDDPLFAAGNDEVCHFMLFEVKADEMRYRAIDINGVAIDQGVISAKRNVNGQ